MIFGESGRGGETAGKRRKTEIDASLTLDFREKEESNKYCREYY